MIILTLTEEVTIITKDGNQVWDKGEEFALVQAGPKRHGKGNYPKRVISLTDGSMVAFAVLEQMSVYKGHKIYKTERLCL